MMSVPMQKYSGARTTAEEFVESLGIRDTVVAASRYRRVMSESDDERPVCAAFQNALQFVADGSQTVRADFAPWYRTGIGRLCRINPIKNQAQVSKPGLDPGQAVI